MAWEGLLSLEFLLDTLTSAQPYIGLWLLAAGLDIAFGGPRALSILPGLESAIVALLGAAQKYTARRIKSTIILSFVGLCFWVLLSACLAVAGLGLNAIVFSHSAILALAAVLVARSVGMKRVWSNLSQTVSTMDESNFQPSISGLTQQFAFRHSGAFLAFVTLGFAGLWPYLLLTAMWDARLFDQLSSNSPTISKTTAQAHFARFPGFVAHLILSVAAMFGALTLSIALLFKPKTHWGKSTLALMKPSMALINRPLLVMAVGNNWSLMKTAPNIAQPTWFGPRSGRAKLTAKDLADALIVTLVAFAVLNGFLLVIWLAVASR